jgi:hypothetical protein
VIEVSVQEGKGETLEESGWHDEEVSITLYRTVDHFLMGWYNDFQINFNPKQYLHIKRDELNSLVEGNNELELKEKDGTFYVTAVFYVDWNRKEDDPSRCIWTKKTLNIEYHVYKPYPDVMYIVVHHVDGRTDFIEDDCQKAS